MFRREGALILESTGRSLTFDGDFSRMHIEMCVKSRGVRMKAEYVLDDREMDRLYQYLYDKLKEKEREVSQNALDKKKRDVDWFLKGGD